MDWVEPQGFHSSDKARAAIVTTDLATSWFVALPLTYQILNSTARPV